MKVPVLVRVWFPTDDEDEAIDIVRQIQDEVHKKHKDVEVEIVEIEYL